MDPRRREADLVRARLADEQGALVREAPLRVALCYPSPYAVGMSSLGFQTIYREIHAHPGAAAERAFLPDDPVAFREAGAALTTYESQDPVSHFGIVAFSVAYELELTGLFEMLSLAGLPVLREERTAAHPLVVAGGPLTFSNPEPLEPFVDIVVMGEAEALVHELLDLTQSGLARPALLDRLAGRPGFHAPGRGLPVPPVARAPDDKLPAVSQFLTPHTELRSMFLVEAARGCSRSCAYCVMRRTTDAGMRTVPPERLLALVPPEAKRVGLVGASVTDHPRLTDIVRALVDGGRGIGISSLRADRLTPELVGLLARGGYQTLTTAADGASQRLRDAVDRRTTEEHLVRAAELAREARLKRLKIYEILGLPGETDDDVDELAALAKRLSSILPVSLGIAPFAAKRNTPLDGSPFEPIGRLEEKLARLRRQLRGRVELRPTSPRWAFVEYMLAQCGPEAGLAAFDAWRAGGSFAAFRRAFEARGARPRPGRAATSPAPREGPGA